MTGFLLDENLSSSTRDFLIGLGYDVKSVADYKMLGCADYNVLKKLDS
jgi:hypothetical protein